MIFLIGAEGKIGLNIGAELNRLNTQFTSVTRTGGGNSWSFERLLDEIKDFEQAVIINSATLSINKLQILLGEVKSKTKIIHISSVSIYGNSTPPNIVRPVNAYGEKKLLEEKEILQHNNYIIIRLANIYGGVPETSGVLALYQNSRLEFVETDPHGNELIRDYVGIDKLLAFIIKSINIKTSCIVNVSSGVGSTLTEFCARQGIDTSHLTKVVCKDDTIFESVVSPTYLNY